MCFHGELVEGAGGSEPVGDVRPFSYGIAYETSVESLLSDRSLGELHNQGRFDGPDKPLGWRDDKERLTFNIIMNGRNVKNNRSIEHSKILNVSNPSQGYNEI